MNTNKRLVSAKEEKLYKVLSPLSEFGIYLKHIHKKYKFYTVRELLKLCDIDCDSLSADIKKKLDLEVSQVCRAGSRFSKNCICVELYDDGEEVARWANKNGALFCITKEKYVDVPCLVVENPTELFVKLCGFFKNLFQVETTAIVGSIGKTTTKRMISSVYSAERYTYCDPENENQIDCVGYMAQHIPSHTAMYVQEVSEDLPGSVCYISQILKPQIAVITGIDISHFEAYGSKDSIIEEILSVSKGMNENGVFIINIDDESVKQLAGDKQIISVAIENRSADYYGMDIKITSDGLSFNIVERLTNKRYPILLHNVFARHNIYSALEAFAAGVTSGISYDNILKGLNSYQTVGKRQNVFRAKSDIIIYADCYNAVAKSVQSAVEGACKIPIRGKRLAVIGDIEEVGDISNEVHEQIIEYLIRSDFDMAFFYGNKLKKVLDYREDLLLNSKVVYCETKQVLVSKIAEIVASGDLVLFKASRKSKLEDVIKKLWPLKFGSEMVKYYLPIIRWRLKTILS